MAFLYVPNTDKQSELGVLQAVVNVIYCLERLLEGNSVTALVR